MNQLDGLIRQIQLSNRRAAALKLDLDEAVASLEELKISADDRVIMMLLDGAYMQVSKQTLMPIVSKKVEKLSIQHEAAVRLCKSLERAHKREVMNASSGGITYGNRPG